MADQKEVKTLQIHNKEESKVQEQVFKEFLEDPIKDEALDTTPNTCCVQALRSSADWSIGLAKNAFECSIYNAYIHYIGKADHYIYIESQFFVSAYKTIDCPVKNRIADALFNRILIAHKKKRRFKIFIMAPLYPSKTLKYDVGYPGDIAEADGTGVMRQIYHHEQLTLGYKKGALMERIKAEGINPSDYIRILGLRNHTCNKAKPITELLYIHSKLLIVDDNYVLIGSANINDRSLLGYRDSELAVIIVDGKKVQATMNDRKYEARSFARRLRMKLMMVSFIRVSIGTSCNEYGGSGRSYIRKVLE